MSGNMNGGGSCRSWGAGLALVLAAGATLALLACGGGGSRRIAPPAGESVALGNCGDAQDNDGDGCTDAADAGCGGKESCATPTDDDCDGFVNVADPDCQESAAAGNCGDATDNDGDGCTDGGDAGCGGVETSCVNGEDDDCDGATDCADSDCSGDGACPENCGNGVDDDGDDCVDGADSACGGTETSCVDGADNDCDLALNCADGDCFGIGPCLEDCETVGSQDGDDCSDVNDADCGGREIGLCADGIDNDCDGLTDEPQDCVEDVGANCADGEDNDGDALVDCADPTCTEECPENCTNGSDDDADALEDCKDPECSENVACPEDCSNLSDDDANGLIDCLADGVGGSGGPDGDCDCGNENTVDRCQDGVDNDGNGMTDCDETACQALVTCSSCTADFGGGDDGSPFVECYQAKNVADCTGFKKYDLWLNVSVIAGELCITGYTEAVGGGPDPLGTVFDGTSCTGSCADDAIDTFECEMGGRTLTGQLLAGGKLAITIEDSCGGSVGATASADPAGGAAAKCPAPCG